MWKYPPVLFHSPLYRSLHNRCSKTSILVPTLGEGIFLFVLLFQFAFGNFTKTDEENFYLFLLKNEQHQEFFLYHQQ